MDYPAKGTRLTMYVPALVTVNSGIPRTTMFRRHGFKLFSLH
jgi:hypothetical protein